MSRAPLHEQEIRELIGVPGTGERTVDSVDRLDDGSDRWRGVLKSYETLFVRCRSLNRTR